MTKSSSTVHRFQLPVRKLGDYSIGAPESIGKRTLVFRSRSTNGDLAIKVLHPKLAQHRTELLRFYDDAKVSLLFDHQHILPTLEVNEASGFHFAVSPWAKHGTLKEYIRRCGPLWEAQAISIVQQVWSGLDVVQQTLGYHGRLHPGNILLQDNLSPLITGVSRLPAQGEARLKKSSRVSDQQACSAPELFRQHGNVDESVDHFAVAATLYFMLTGRLPSGRSSLSRVMEQKIGKENRWQRWLPADTSPQIITALATCLRTQPTPQRQRAVSHVPHTSRSQSRAKVSA